MMAAANPPTCDQRCRDDRRIVDRSPAISPTSEASELQPFAGPHPIINSARQSLSTDPDKPKTIG